jgi:hypothetical protein
VNTSTVSAYRFQTTDNNAVLGLNAYSFGGGVSIGNGARANGTDAIAIGVGTSNNSAYTIAIGTNIANTVATSAKCIILNADTGFEPLPTQSDSLYINPIRRDVTSNVLYYNTTTKEITYSTIVGDGNAGISSFSTLNVSSLLTASTIYTNNIQFNTTNTVVGSNAIIESGTFNIAIGYGADVRPGVGSNAIAIGHGINIASNNSINVGYFDVGVYPGGATIGSNTICIGNNIGAGGSSVSASNIVLNASGVNVGSGNVGAFIVNPVRQAGGVSTLSYNPTTYEISYSDGRVYSQLFTSSLVASSITTSSILGTFGSFSTMSISSIASATTISTITTSYINALGSALVPGSISTVKASISAMTVSTINNTFAGYGMPKWSMTSISTITPQSGTLTSYLASPLISSIPGAGFVATANISYISGTGITANNEITALFYVNGVAMGLSTVKTNTGAQHIQQIPLTLASTFTGTGAASSTNQVSVYIKNNNATPSNYSTIQGTITLTTNLI